MGICNSKNSKREKANENTNTNVINKPVSVNVHKVSTMKADEKAIMNCKLCRDKIKDYIKKLEKNEILKKEKAKTALISKDKTRAKMFLNQGKMYREQINIANGQLTMIEEQITGIESALIQKDALSVLNEGNKILKQLNEEVNIEKWENIKEDMESIKEQQDEIANFLKSHNINEDKYEEELNEELERLNKVINKEEAKEDVIVLPDAGTKEVEVLDKEEKEIEIKQDEKEGVLN
jgi:charged multivesicular body protein 6